MKTFSPSQIETMRSQFSKIATVNPDSDNYKALLKTVSGMSAEMLTQLAGADIKWVSYFAKQEIQRRKS